MSSNSDHLKKLAERLASIQREKPESTGGATPDKVAAPDLAKRALERLKAQGPRQAEARAKKEKEAGTLGDYYDPDVRQKGSQDAMDHRSSKGKFSKKEKQAYAKEMHMQSLLQPPKEPLPEWLNDPALLPKAPPGRK